MTAHDQNRLLGIFYAVIGGLISLCAFGLIAMPFMLTPVNGSDPAAYRANILFFAVFGISFLVLGLLALTVGVGVLQQRKWARIASIVMGILFLINFPVGMALGIYTLIFMFSEKGQRLYSNNPTPPQWGPRGY